MDMMNSVFRSLILMFFCSVSLMILSVGIGESCPDGAKNCNPGLICDSATCCDPIKDPATCLCNKDNDCSNNYKCDPTTKKCVQCLDHKDCTQTGLCDPKKKECVSCKKDEDCPKSQVGDRQGEVHLKCKITKNKRVAPRCVECLSDCNCCLPTDSPCKGLEGDSCGKICSKNKCINQPYV